MPGSPMPRPCPQVRANLATALGVGPKQDLPPIIFQTEVADVGDQMGELAGLGDDWGDTWQLCWATGAAVLNWVGRICIGSYRR